MNIEYVLWGIPSFFLLGYLMVGLLKAEWF